MIIKAVQLRERAGVNHNSLIYRSSRLRYIPPLSGADKVRFPDIRFG
ncbi:MAG TPA: hypothetical protein VFS89_07555 [Nitrosospira sp.]|nr:hypothetical protein [Nitrosospira sp.]